MTTPAATGGACVDAQGVALDSFRKEIPGKRIRFVRIDAEGYELLIITRAVRTIEQWQRIFYCELFAEYCKRYGYAPSDVFDFSEDRGYKSYQICQAGGVLSVGASEYPGKGNVLFMPSENALS